MIEAKLDRGRGVVATVLIERGTLRVGDIIVCGGQWGRVRALVDDRGQNVDAAGPSVPVEILGLDGVPEAGDPLVVVDNERRAREITEYRQRKKRTQASGTTTRSSVEEMFSQLASGEAKELPVVIKSDVHGSMEAIVAGLQRLGTDEVSVRVLHAGVGAITESDVTLALASKAWMLGFNVRANAQARELARRDGVEIRYHSIIYELLDEAKAALSGLLSPTSRETTLGHAEVREVFTISKVGKIAGCRVIDGLIRRGARVRLLRDDIVIHDGALGSLKRFKDDVREVREGFECGIGIEGYNDLREGDVIEAYEVEQVARTSERPPRPPAAVRSPARAVDRGRSDMARRRQPGRCPAPSQRQLRVGRGAAPRAGGAADCVVRCTTRARRGPHHGLGGADEPGSAPGASVFVIELGGELRTELRDALARAAPRLRGEAARRLHLKYAPGAELPARHLVSARRRGSRLC